MHPSLTPSPDLNSKPESMCLRCMLSCNMQVRPSRQRLVWTSAAMQSIMWLMSSTLACPDLTWTSRRQRRTTAKRLPRPQQPLPASLWQGHRQAILRPAQAAWQLHNLRAPRASRAHRAAWVCRTTTRTCGCRTPSNWHALPLLASACVHETCWFACAMHFLSRSRLADMCRVSETSYSGGAVQLAVIDVDALQLQRPW